jgi:hypothetical protein
MPKAERDKLLTRIADLQGALRETHSADLRATVREAIADCEEKLADLERRPNAVLVEQAAG